MNTLKLKESTIKSFVNKTKFNTSGTFVPYKFIAIAVGENNKPYLYHSIQTSSNSWTNYPGRKVWTSNEHKNKKEEVLNWLLSELEGFNINKGISNGESEIDPIVIELV